MNYVLRICVMVCALIICVHNMPKVNNQFQSLSIKSGKTFTGDWTDRDIIIHQDALISGIFMMGSINRDITINLLKNISLTGGQESMIRFVIAPGRKITIKADSADTLDLVFDNLKISWPDLIHDGRQLILKNVHIIGTESAEISAPNIESVSLVLQEDQKKFIPVSK